MKQDSIHILCPVVTTCFMIQPKTLVSGSENLQIMIIYKQDSDLCHLSHESYVTMFTRNLPLKPQSK